MWIWYCNSDCECDCHLPLCTLWCTVNIEFEWIRAKRFFQSCCQFYNYMLQYFMRQNALRALFGSICLSLFRFRIPVARLNGMRVCAFNCVINGLYIAFVWWNSHFDRNRIGNHVKSAVFNKRTHTHTHTHDYEYMHLYIYFDPFTC